jgi:hypothetical protein
MQYLSPKYQNINHYQVQKPNKRPSSEGKYEPTVILIENPECGFGTFIEK